MNTTIILIPKAAGLGFEPKYTVPETAVLPLDDPAALGTNLLPPHITTKS